jgi:hypothetical protein
LPAVEQAQPSPHLTRPLGAPVTQPAVAGSSRISIRSNSVAVARNSGASAEDRHSSGGGMGGGGAVCSTVADPPRSPKLASARILSTMEPSGPGWETETWPVDIVRPTRNTSVVTSTRPGPDGVRKYPLNASGSPWASMSSSRCCRAVVARHITTPPLTPLPIRQPSPNDPAYAPSRPATGSTEISSSNAWAMPN